MFTSDDFTISEEQTAIVIWNTYDDVVRTSTRNQRAQGGRGRES